MADSRSPVTGLPRPRRIDPSPHDLANRIVALQRKNASATAPTRLPQRRFEDVDDYDRGGSQAGPSRILFDPTRPQPSSRPESRDPRVERPERSDRQDRLPVNGLDRTDRLDRSDHVETRMVERPDDFRRPPSRPLDARRGEASKKLFIPDIHDPHHFQTRLQPPPPQTSPLPSESSSSFSRSLLRRPGINGWSAEEEADKERERRRRREGSERGSLHSKKKESDAKSRESRSSEGSESLKDRDRGKGKSKGDTGVKAILKDIHNRIRLLETELNEMHKKMASDPEAGISVLLDQPASRQLVNGDDSAAWIDLIGKHKELADLHHLFLVRVFDPLIPSTFQQLAVKYNIPSRLWQVSFHLILERLRLAWMTAHPAALDLLTDLVYDAYKFYTDLLEDQALVQFRTAWIEALGDLARYRMTIASHVNEGRSGSPGMISRQDDGFDDDGPAEPSGASIGAEVAQTWDVEDKETWRTTARDWYSMGVTEKPGEGRLHHHLALLCRDVKGQEGRALHHFTKSLVVTHEYAPSRESLLPLFDSPLQVKRSLPEATAMDLFVRLHGMLFTRIDLDNFSTVLSRFMERLEEDNQLDDMHRQTNLSQVDWMTMGSVNLSSMLQYGAPIGVIRKALALEGQERRRAQVGTTEEDGDGDESGDKAEVLSGEEVPPGTPIPPPSTGFGFQEDSSDAPVTLTDAIDLAFAMLALSLEHPTRQQGLHTVLNPYITLILTFIATIFRQPHVGSIILPHIPWVALVDFFNSRDLEIKGETRLIAGPPLPEDWTIRGMEWVGRRVYERGFWKTKSNSRGSGSGAFVQPRSGERFQSEMDVLLAEFDSALDISEGVVDEVEGTDLTDGAVAVNHRRWKRVAWAAGVMVKYVDGLELRDGKVVIEGVLKAKVEEIEVQRQAERARRDAAARTKMVRDKAQEPSDVESGVDGISASDSEDDDPELAILRDRRRHLRALLNAPPPQPSPPRKWTKPVSKLIKVVKGYTMLVFDTNVLLSSLHLFERIVNSGAWSVVVPLPVVTELDGLAKNPPPLGAAASSAIKYLESHIRSHSLSLKVQTSRGNYLSDLLIRTESQGERGEGDSATRTMDDLILNIATFQMDHFTDRSSLLRPTGQNGGGRDGAVKVLLVTFDRNLRVRARGRGIDAADEKEMAAILGK